MQIFFDIVDDDYGNSSNELIDRFVINTTLLVGTVERKTHSGIFGFAQVDISLALQCAENFYDANCERFCEENCTCGPGLTGPFCTESIDDCVVATCGVNQICVDGHLSHSCVCAPGYTGPRCLMDIDECAGVNCNNGICEQGRGSFTCVCTPGYAGQFCEKRLDGYQLQVTIHSVRNPEGRCADAQCSGCCDAFCPRSRCNYYLHYCQRPIGTPVSLEHEEYQGNCSALNTLSESQSTESFQFTYSMISLSGTEWVRYINRPLF